MSEKSVEQIKYPIELPLHFLFPYNFSNDKKDKYIQKFEFLVEYNPAVKNCINKIRKGGVVLKTNKSKVVALRKIFQKTGWTSQEFLSIWREFTRKINEQIQLQDVKDILNSLGCPITQTWESALIWYILTGEIKLLTGAYSRCEVDLDKKRFVIVLKFSPDATKKDLGRPVEEAFEFYEQSPNNPIKDLKGISLRSRLKKRHTPAAYVLSLQENFPRDNNEIMYRWYILFHELDEAGLYWAETQKKLSINNWGHFRNSIIVINPILDIELEKNHLKEVFGDSFGKISSILKQTKDRGILIKPDFQEGKVIVELPAGYTVDELLKKWPEIQECQKQLPGYKIKKQHSLKDKLLNETIARGKMWNKYTSTKFENNVKKEFARTELTEQFYPTDDYDEDVQKKIDGRFRQAKWRTKKYNYL